MTSIRVWTATEGEEGDSNNIFIAWKENTLSDTDN